MSSRSEASPSTSHLNPQESSESDADPVLCNDFNNYLTIVDANNNHNNSVSSDSDNTLHDHLNYLEARERLEEFPGRVPQRRKKSAASGASSSTTGLKKSTMALPTDTDGSSPVIITSQKQQNRHANKNTDLSGKDSTSSPLIQSRGQQGSSSGCRNSRGSPQKSTMVSYNLFLFILFKFKVFLFLFEFLSKLLNFFCSFSSCPQDNCMNLSLLSALMVLGVGCVGCVFFTSR